MPVTLNRIPSTHFPTKGAWTCWIKDECTERRQPRRSGAVSAERTYQEESFVFVRVGNEVESLLSWMGHARTGSGSYRAKMGQPASARFRSTHWLGNRPLG